jgi:hypothetical protein
MNFKTWKKICITKQHVCDNFAQTQGLWCHAPSTIMISKNIEKYGER